MVFNIDEAMDTFWIIEKNWEKFYLNIWTDELEDCEIEGIWELRYMPVWVIGFWALDKLIVSEMHTDKLDAFERAINFILDEWYNYWI